MELESRSDEHQEITTLRKILRIIPESKFKRFTITLLLIIFALTTASMKEGENIGSHGIVIDDSLNGRDQLIALAERIEDDPLTIMTLIARLSHSDIDFNSLDFTKFDYWVSLRGKIISKNQDFYIMSLLLEGNSTNYKLANIRSFPGSKNLHQQLMKIQEYILLFPRDTLINIDVQPILKETLHFTITQSTDKSDTYYKLENLLRRYFARDLKGDLEVEVEMAQTDQYVFGPVLLHFKLTDRVTGQLFFLDVYSIDDVTGKSINVIKLSIDMPPDTKGTKTVALNAPGAAFAEMLSAGEDLYTSVFGPELSTNRSGGREP